MFVPRSLSVTSERKQSPQSTGVLSRVKTKKSLTENSHQTTKCFLVVENNVQ